MKISYLGFNGPVPAVAWNGLTNAVLTENTSEEFESQQVFMKTSMSFDAEVNAANMEFLRKICGIPVKPVRRKKMKRKTFKKALMAHRYDRNAADTICNKLSKSGYSYHDMAAAMGLFI